MGLTKVVCLWGGHVYPYGYAQVFLYIPLEAVPFMSIGIQQLHEHSPCCPIWHLCVHSHDCRQCELRGMRMSDLELRMSDLERRLWSCSCYVPIDILTSIGLPAQRHGTPVHTWVGKHGHAGGVCCSNPCVKKAILCCVFFFLAVGGL